MVECAPARCAGRDGGWRLSERSGAYDTLGLAVVLAAVLVVPTLLGVAAGRLVGLWALGGAVGAAVGVTAASVIVTRTILDRYARLAPPEPKEDRLE